MSSRAVIVLALRGRDIVARRCGTCWGPTDSRKAPKEQSAATSAQK